LNPSQGTQALEPYCRCSVQEPTGSAHLLAAYQVPEADWPLTRPFNVPPKVSLPLVKAPDKARFRLPALSMVPWQVPVTGSLPYFPLTRPVTWVPLMVRLIEPVAWPEKLPDQVPS